MRELIDYGSVLSLAIVFVLVGGWQSFALDLIKDGRSSFVIHVEEDAPESIQEAAQDLRDYAQKVAGVEWPITHAATQPMISLGATKAAAAAGVTTAGLEWEGFRIKPVNGNLYILGPDTGPEENTPQGGTSAGTANGVMTLLEDYFGVRWLMPGPHGDFVPKRANITVPDSERVETPGFLNRRLPAIQPRAPGVARWSRRQKLGLSLFLWHGHNWIRTCPPEMFTQHPEWYAVSGGQRTPPAGAFYKLCPTNPSTIKRFAEAACEYFAHSPNRYCFSLSPSDSDGWCECETCKSFYETDPMGKLSVTPVVIHFYNEVAKLVRQQYPDRLLAGYVYASYVFPPSKPFKLEPNIFLVWAPKFNYGYTLFRPETRELFDQLLPQWPKITTNLAFYDLPNKVSNSLGAVNAPGLEILKFLYPRIKKSGMKGVYVYGHSAWGHAAVTNYLLAKLSWQPLADIDALFQDFCDHAYAEGSQEMQEFFRLVDRHMEAYYLADRKESYTLSTRRLREVYADHFPEMDRLYTAALSKVQDVSARVRLERLGMNLSILLWNLKQKEMIAADYSSPLDISDEQFVQYLNNPENSLYFSQSTARPPRPKTILASAEAAVIPKAAARQPYCVRSGQSVVFMSPAGGPVSVQMIPKRQHGSLAWGYVFDQQGKQLLRFPFRLKQPFVFDAEAGKIYSLTIDLHFDFFRLEIDNAHWGFFTNAVDNGLHFIQDATPFYFEVPAKTADFTVWLKADPPGETAKAVVHTPTGRQINFDCSKLTVDQQTIQVQPGEDNGFWRVEVTIGDTGVLDDFYFKIIEGIPPLVFVDPEKALTVEVAK